MDGVQAGMFCNLGRGDVPIGAIVTELEARGYDQWYVLEQDAAITAGEPAVGAGPLLDVLASIEFLKGIEAPASAKRKSTPDKGENMKTSKKLLALLPAIALVAASLRRL